MSKYFYRFNADELMFEVCTKGGVVCMTGSEDEAKKIIKELEERA